MKDVNTTNEEYSMSRNTFISIVIPTRHRNDALAICLNQLTPETQGISIDEYEIIVTDDGTLNNAKNLIKESYPWIKWIPGPCRGPAANRNNGVSVASGDWIVFTDDDCVPLKNWLRNYKDSIQNNVVVYEGKTICEDKYDPLFYASPINITGGNLWSCNFMIKKTYFNDLHGFDEKFLTANSEDTDLRERIKAKNTSIFFVESAIVHHPATMKILGKKKSPLYEWHSRIWFKAGNKGIFSLRLIKMIIKNRITEVINFGNISFKTLYFIFLAFQEIIFVLPKLKIWSNKYLAEFKNCESAYSYREM